MRQSIYIAMFLLGSLSLAWCQEGPVPAFAQGNGPSDEEVVLPAIVSGDSASPLFPAEGERSNYLSGGLSFITAYDDNALATSSDRVSDTSFALMPYISFNQTRSRLRWQMDYAPGFTFYQRFDGRNQDDQNLSVALEYRLTPHVTVRLKDAFVKTSNFLGGPGQVQQSPFGVAQQSNLTVITPIADRISNGGSGEVNWQFGPNSVLGARGLFYVLHFPDTQNAADLSDTHSQAGEAFVAHRISRIHWVSATYRYQRIVTDLDNSTTLTHSLLLSYTLNFSPTMSFSLFAGPQHADTTSQSIAPSQKWLPAAGATYSWQTNHLGFETNLAHKISDGGGLAAAVRLTTLDAYVRYEWAKNWLARFGGSYGKNELIEPLATFSQDSRSAIGLVAISHQIGEHLTIEASYVRANQKYLDASNGWVAFNRNRPQISISYGFSRPIGR